MRRPALPCLLLLALGACGAPDATDDVDDTDTSAATPTLVGSWSVDGANGLDWLPGGGTLRHVRFGALGEGGGGTLETFGDNPSAELFCGEVLWSGVGRDAVAIGYNPGEATQALLAAVRFVDPDTVELTDERGGTLRLVREAEVPAEAQCGTATLADGVAIDVEPAYWGNLVWDGEDLRYATDSDGTYAIDPDSGALTDAWDFGWGSYQLPLAAEDGALWAVCGCGRNDVIQLVENGGTMRTEVNVTDLGSQYLSISGAYVPEGGKLVLFVGSTSTDDRFVMTVNTVPASPTLVSLVPTTLRPARLTVHDGELWSVSENRKLVRVDPENGEALATLTVDGLAPNEDLRGLASDGTRLWAVGYLSADVGVSRLAEITLP